MWARSGLDDLELETGSMEACDLLLDLKSRIDVEGGWGVLATAIDD